MCVAGLEMVLVVEQWVAVGAHEVPGSVVAEVLLVADAVGEHSC